MSIRVMTWLFVLVVVLFAGASFINFKPYLRPGNDLSRPSVIIVTFGHLDQFGVWDGEAAPFGKHLVNMQDISAQLPFCQDVYTGTIFNRPVILAITGMAKIRTSACTGNILQFTKGNVREIILSGIGGISPLSLDGRQTQVGDVCVSSLTVDFDRQYYSSDLAGSWQQKPEFWTASSTYSSRHMDGSPQLANEIYQAAQNISWPLFPQSVKSVNSNYGVQGDRPYVWGPEKCMEISSDLFWHDSGVDTLARQTAAEWLSKSRQSAVSADQIVVITSMEAASVGTIVQLWNTNHNSTIPFAYVRSASNFDHTVISAGLPVVAGKTSLESGMQSENTDYPIQIQALPVLKLMESRSK